MTQRLWLDFETRSMINLRDTGLDRYAKDETIEVLMLAWMDDEALHRTLTTGRCTYWSRSRQEYWVKGDTSGHVQRVVSVALDCDGDAVLVKVDQAGGACHTGDRTCFDAGRLDVAAT